jgi:hypothetical protein
MQATLQVSGDLGDGSASPCRLAAAAATAWRDAAASRDGAAPVERASQPRSDRHHAAVIAARPVVVVPLPSLTALPLHAHPATRRRRSIGRTFIFFNRTAADVDGNGRGMD